MKKLFLFSFVANVLLGLASLFVLPETVAIHFGANGIPDGWASKYANFAILLFVEILVFLSIYLSPELVVRFDPKWISLPNKHYWLLPENRDKMSKLLGDYLNQFGCAIFALLFWVGILASKANLSDPVVLNEPLFLWPFGIFLIYSVVWSIRLIFIFKIPSK